MCDQISVKEIDSFFLKKVDVIALIPGMVLIDNSPFQKYFLLQYEKGYSDT